jgi:cyclopropane-fatty-acyl-phospholipid synthase
MSELQPFYEDVQAHYDLSDEFFALFLDDSMTYSCAYFERPEMSLGEAQLAKIDLSLGKCDLKPGMTLLDIGCGWGATACRAATTYGTKVIGLTLSEHQHARCTERAAQLPGDVPRPEFRLQGWEEFEPGPEGIDRIVSIGAFEHFRHKRYPEFFARCHRWLPSGGRMLLHTIVLSEPAELRERGIAVTHEHVLFAKWIGKVIFPGGQLAAPSRITGEAQRAGFGIERIHPLGLHYAQTLEIWAANLEGRRGEALELVGETVYQTYMKYLLGCAANFRSGHIDIMQFTLIK